MTSHAAGRRTEPPLTAAEGPTAPRPLPARRITPSQAVLARPRLVVLPILVLLVPSVALALLREPVHSAEARLLVGGFNVEAQAVPGFVEASRTLAETYSRLVATRAIEARAAEILDVDLERVSGAIDATSVPESSIIRVIGTSGDADEAVRLAAAAAQALEDYADDASGGADLENLLDEYRQASLVLNQHTARRDALQRAYDARVEFGAATQADADALAAAQADIDRAQLEANTLGTAYEAQRARTASSGNIDLVAPASGTGSDRSRNLQLAVAGSLLLGAIAGVALASLAANRAALRGA